ncbi:MAG: methyltransferase domain-containing protein [Geobacteraceae bacterium]|nr:methyltransferase domain-containing protein [Geobacteraceae bacterium]NTW81020.1 methyltransferase domain-containing protein [Geobacteraceae bacterium]
MTDSCCTSTPALRGPVPLSHLFLRNFLCEGHTAVDATCGNGHDTLLLSRLVGVSGHVWGFDIQPQAIGETGRRLAEAGLSSRATLLQTGHEELVQHVTGPVQVVLFNLGYRPGGDRSIITRPDTTGIALEQSLGLLALGGIVLVTVYPGHTGGDEEQSAVEKWATNLDPRTFYCWRMGQTNVSPDAPYLLLAQRAL